MQTNTQKWWLSHYHYDYFAPFDTKFGIGTTHKNSIRFQFTTGIAGDIDGIAISGIEAAISKPIVFARSVVSKEIAAAHTLTTTQPNGNYKATRKTAATVAEKKNYPINLPNA